MAESIHTARWMAQIADEHWEIHLFSSQDCVQPHPELKNTTIYQTLFPRKSKDNHKNRKIRANFFGVFQFVLNRSLNYVSPNLYQKLIDKRIIKDLKELRLKQLDYLIRKLKPDIIHSMEFQSAGYAVAEAKKRFQGKFPTWIATNWGSDIYFYGRLPDHLPKIKEILSSCDYYSCECQRDVCLAKNIGLKGKVLSVFPNTGGFNLQEVEKWRVKGRTSKRRIILLKGYQGIFGRALVGLRALERCAEVLKGYKIVIFSIGKGTEVDFAAQLFTNKTGIETKIVPLTAHKNILKLQGQARIYIGLSISDAISTSLIEAIVMGSFPIQSNTACADEWIEDGKTGVLVPPEDPEVIEKAIRKALTDDQLVDRAAQINWQIAKQKLSMEKLKKQTIEFYHQVIEESK